MLNKLVPTTINGWQLYEVPGAGKAAQKLAKELRKSFTRMKKASAGKFLAIAKEERERMDGVADTLSEFGAVDTEPCGVIDDAFERLGSEIGFAIECYFGEVCNA